MNKTLHTQLINAIQNCEISNEIEELSIQNADLLSAIRDTMYTQFFKDSQGEPITKEDEKELKELIKEQQKIFEKLKKSIEKL